LIDEHHDDVKRSRVGGVRRSEDRAGQAAVAGLPQPLHHAHHAHHLGRQGMEASLGEPYQVS
jgi:hypothetical protein